MSLVLPHSAPRSATLFGEAQEQVVQACSCTCRPMSNRVYVDPKGAYDEYQYPVVFLPPYENPPPWIPLHERLHHSDYNNELTQFLPRTIQLKKPSGAQLGFNIRGGKASQLGIFISKVITDSDADHAGLQEGDQVLAVNDIDFQDIEHSKAVEILKSAKEIVMRVRYFPYNFRRQKERTVH
ncbi:PDZ domain-containing protein 11 isoform X1 [Hemitrygon akajei]|uniref:PDZ domain-containing protein 11 isoform X1 n=2 Tax=Hemitrygon akajei TaxID=2704970 RepID=UPI003BF971F4